MQFNVKACSIQGIFKTADVVKNDPSSLFCPASSIDVLSESWKSPRSRHRLISGLVEVMVRFPIPSEEIDRFRADLGTGKPGKPYAFIYGHGLWNVSCPLQS